MHALQLSSGDLIADRRASYAEMLWKADDRAAAIDLMRDVLSLVPNWAAGWFRLGEMLDDDKRPAEAADADALAALRSCHRELAECTDLAQAARIDARFHEQIARAAGNAIVALVLSSLGDLGETSRLRTLSQSGLKKAIAHHEAILAAIEAGLPDDAAKLMRTHVEEAATDLEASEGIATRTA